jgi:UDP-N-acetyl-D-mannosaminuronic acid dehydrogenase
MTTSNEPLRVCVLGLGYIGMPTAALLAASGHAVFGVDRNPRVLDMLARGCVTTREPGLDELVARVVEAGTLVGGAKARPADAFILAVPTPVRGLAYKRADLSFVAAAAESVGTVLRRGNLVVLESTSPPGTTEQLVRPILERASGLTAGDDFCLAHCPERVLPGRILDELVDNDRVIGGVDAQSTVAARELYASFVRGEILLTDATTAELIKLMENTHRDVNIALANEFALVAEQLGVDVWHAIALANRHPRVQLLRPGPGVGGHCIAVDPWFVVAAAPRCTPLISASRAVNDAMPRHVTDLAADALGGLSDSCIVTLGLTYKADVDDIRESPAVEIVELLRRAGAEVRAHDAVVAAGVDVADLAIDADCVMLLVDHPAYAALDPFVIGARMRRRVMLDTRNFLPPPRWTEAGFDLVRLGDGHRYSPAAELIGVDS